MVAHGYHKVFGGLGQFSHMVGNMGLPAWLGYVAAFTELVGGLMILAGFFTRPAAFAICIDLVVAIWKVHWRNGLMGSADRPVIFANDLLQVFGAVKVALHTPAF